MLVRHRMVLDDRSQRQLTPQPLPIRQHFPKRVCLLGSQANIHSPSVPFCLTCISGPATARSLMVPGPRASVISLNFFASTSASCCALLTSSCSWARA